MYKVDRPLPKNCHECPCMRYERLTHDEPPVGCVYTGQVYNWGLSGRPPACPIIEDDEDDLK